MFMLGIVVFILLNHYLFISRVFFPKVRKSIYSPRRQFYYAMWFVWNVVLFQCNMHLVARLLEDIL